LGNWGLDDCVIAYRVFCKGCDALAR